MDHGGNAPFAVFSRPSESFAVSTMPRDVSSRALRMRTLLRTTQHGGTHTRNPCVAPGRQNRYLGEGRNKIFPSQAGFRNYQRDLSFDTGQFSRSDSFVDSLTLSIT